MERVSHLVAKQSFVRWDKPIGANSLDKQPRLSSVPTQYPDRAAVLKKF